MLKVFHLWFEVKRPRLRTFIYEMIYSAAKLIDRSWCLPCPFKTDFIETRFGKFKVRPFTTDMASASPAFERRDMDYLLRLGERLRKQGSKILFLDIGADIGTFTITVGNRFRNYESMCIMAFEPAGSSYKLLKENIEQNGLAGKVEAFDFALYNENGVEVGFQFNVKVPGRSGLRLEHVEGLRLEKVMARTLDSVLFEKAKDFDVLIFKIGVGRSP